MLLIVPIYLLYVLIVSFISIVMKPSAEMFSLLIYEGAIVGLIIHIMCLIVNGMFDE